MSDDRQSPPRKRARLASPPPAPSAASLASPPRSENAVEIDAESAENDAQTSTVPIPVDAAVPRPPPPTVATPTPRLLPSLFPFVLRFPVETPAPAVAVAPAVDAELESAQVANATMMAAASEEASSTDDEELQQLSMVVPDPKVAVDLLSGEGGAEVKFDDLLATVFAAAKEGKLPAIHQCFKLLKRSDNAGALMKRAVNAEDDTGLTLLMISVRNNLVPLTSFLLHEGADVNHSNVRAYCQCRVGAFQCRAPDSRHVLLHRRNGRTRCCWRPRKDSPT